MEAASTRSGAGSAAAHVLGPCRCALAHRMLRYPAACAPHSGWLETGVAQKPEGVTICIASACCRACSGEPAGVQQGVISIRLGAGPARYASSSSSPLERLRWSSGVLAVEVDRPVPADLLVDLPAEG